VFDKKVRGDTNQYYRDFVRAMRDIGYEGYMSYELCHDLPVVDGQTVDIGYAHQQAQLAAEFMRDLIATADRRESVSASPTTSGTSFGRPA
jgi:sugar phosphate isomerase/epimerase